MKYPAQLEALKQQVAAFIATLDHPDDAFTAFDLLERSAQTAEAMARHYELNDREQFLTTAATWFCDLGRAESADAYTEAAAVLATELLGKASVSEDDFAEILQIIQATQSSQHANTLLEQIAWDAATFYWGADDFDAISRLLRSAWDTDGQDKAAWQAYLLQRGERHEFLTDYALQMFGPQKKKNLKRLRKKVEKKAAGPEDNRAEAETNAKKAKSDRPERTIETMFRVTATNSQRLSDQADTKAHIMISVNTIILPLMPALMVSGRLENAGAFQYPAMLLLLVNLLTIVFAVLATRPQIPKGTFSQGDLDEQRANLLFFGNFYKMHFDDYRSAMFLIMNDRTYLHTSLLRDIYGQGVALGRKYRLLTVAYNIFMFGLIITVMAFFIALNPNFLH